MPRSVKDILDHGDELAKRFEDYEPPTAMSATPRYSLRCAALSSPALTPSGRSRTLSTSPASTATRGPSSALSSAPQEKPPDSGTATSKACRQRSTRVAEPAARIVSLLRCG